MGVGSMKNMKKSLCKLCLHRFPQFLTLYTVVTAFMEEKWQYTTIHQYTWIANGKSLAGEVPFGKEYMIRTITRWIDPNCTNMYAVVNVSNKGTPNMAISLIRKEFCAIAYRLRVPSSS
jgi:hypothetical protein